MPGARMFQKSMRKGYRLIRNPKRHKDALEAVKEMVQNLNLTADERLRRREDLRKIINSLLGIPRFFTKDIFDFHQGLKTDLGIGEEKFLIAKPCKFMSPRDFAKILHSDVASATVYKLFKNQFKTVWDTRSGIPEMFSYYGFCNDVETGRRVQRTSGKPVMTYQTRKAHVISRLYHAQEKLSEIKELDSHQLCPPVYTWVRNVDNKLTKWTKWKWDAFERKFIIDENQGNEGSKKQLEDDIDQVGWISYEPLRNYIKENSKRIIEGERDILNETSHLYWLVLEEDDETIDDPLAGSVSQVYVGMTKSLQDRWINNGSSHCRSMRRALNTLCNNDRLESLSNQLLVDLRLLLHRACNPDGTNCGLFIMNHDGDLKKTERKILKDGVQLKTVQRTYLLQPRNMLDGMNGRR